MIPKKNRLTSLFFKDLFKKSSSLEYPAFSVKYKKEKKREEFGLSVVVSRKVSHKAIERNLLKRRFLSMVLQHKAVILKDVSYVFYLKKTIKDIDKSIICNEIKTSLEKIYEKYS